MTASLFQPTRSGYVPVGQILVIYGKKPLALWRHASVKTATAGRIVKFATLFVTSLVYSSR